MKYKLFLLWYLLLKQYKFWSGKSRVFAWETPKECLFRSFRVTLFWEVKVALDGAYLEHLKWCQISFLYEKKYRRYVQGNFLMGPHFFAIFLVLFYFIFLFYLFFGVCRVFSCSALPNVSFSTACYLALDGTYTFF